jgi:NADPH:quinone reductase-like Zn-dependent oxidoreductase
MTALRALEVAGLVLDKRVLVTGANGGVGRFAIQLARESGARVSALVRDAPASQALLRRLGARDVVERLAGDYDLIVDAVGGATFGLAIEHLATRGIVVNVANSDQGRNRHLPRRTLRPRAWGANLHLEPPRRARCPRERSQRPHPPLRAHGRGASGRPDRVRNVVART